MKMKCTFFLTISIPFLIGGLIACAPDVERVVLPDPFDRRIDFEKYRHKVVSAYADCSTANNTPVGACSNWVTGPASAQNANTKMYRRDKVTGAWQATTLHETDQGWPVMSPDGKSLEIMAYGDTWVTNQTYTTANRLADIQSCANQSVADICGTNMECQDVFNTQTDKMEACAYWIAKVYHGSAVKGMALAAFDNQNNVVFMDAEINTKSTYRFKFKEHLRDKVILHNSLENSYKGKSYFTGVYSTDYFYVCPKTASACADADKILHFLTGTVYWHLDQPDVNKLTEDQKYFKLTREGMGIYLFGTLANKKDNSKGCRVPFAPISRASVVSCSSTLSEKLRPKHEHFAAPGVKIVRSENPNVIWGWGGKFAQAIVMHDFVDPAHSGLSKSQEYVYFLGSGEVTSSIDKATKSAHYMPTNKIYMARLPASKTALFKGKFEYYQGKAGGKTLWGPYDKAKPLLSTPLPIFPTSFCKRHGRYYIAATFILDFTTGFTLAHGMYVTSSKDGYAWDKHDYVKYSDLVGADAAASLVYGHAWVPEGLYPHATAIPYVFSVWKAIDGYAADFCFKGKTKHPLPLDKRFLFYNTKMYLYWPK